MSGGMRPELERATLADVAIRAAIAEVERLPPDERLRSARVLLERALARVVEFLDGSAPDKPLVDGFR